MLLIKINTNSVKTEILLVLRKYNLKERFL
nr:MAG TPA: hypothetical protein [Caudoviricetes sp.]